MGLRQAYLGMIKAFDGGWEAMAGALGFTQDALSNRVYERKGQSFLVETAMEMQRFSKTTLFAEEIAKQSGGVFLRLPEGGEYDRDELLDKFNELYAELGDLSATFRESTKDNKIDGQERQALADIGQHIHRTVEELLGLTFSIYCRKEPGKKAEKA